MSDRFLGLDGVQVESTEHGQDWEQEEDKSRTSRIQFSTHIPACVKQMHGVLDRPHLHCSRRMLLRKVCKEYPFTKGIRINKPEPSHQAECTSCKTLFFWNNLLQQSCTFVSLLSNHCRLWSVVSVECGLRSVEFKVFVMCCSSVVCSFTCMSVVSWPSLHGLGLLTDRTRSSNLIPGAWDEGYCISHC